MTTPSFDPALAAAFGTEYELRRELTGGGMSRVFLANERALNREVVIKVLPAELAAGVNRERFRREIQVAAQLQHPHIVPLHSAGAEGDVLYYTMPYIAGESLKHAIQSGQHFSPRDALRILHDVVDALAYAHERGVIHRDIKPANVLRSGTHAMVTDFGVAKAISAAMSAVGMTTSGMAIGTPAYMAPEQLAGDPAADHRMDIYAVGLLAYELLTGEMPFAGPSPQATMAAQLTRDPVPLARRRADVPEALSALVTKCLAKDPARRPQTARELCNALDELTSASGDYPPLLRPNRARPIVVGSGILVMLAIGVLWVVRGRASGPPGSPDVAARGAPRGQSSGGNVGGAAGQTGTGGSGGSAASAPLTRADSLAIAKALVAAEVLKKNREAAKPVATAQAPESPAIAPAERKDRPSSGRPGGRAADAAVANRPSGVSPFVDSVARVALVLAAERASDQFTLPAPNPLSREAFAARAANLGPARSVLIAVPQTVPARPDVDTVARTLVRRMRAVLPAPAAGGRYSVAEVSTASPDTWSDQRTADSVSRATGAEILVALIPAPRRDSSVSWIILARDLTANESYAVRSTQHRVSRDSLDAGIGALAAATKPLLDQMDRAPRRGAGDPARRVFDERAANMGPPRRVVVANHAPDQNPAVQEAGSVIMDVVRRTLASSRRFVPVTRDSTLAMLEKTRDVKTVAGALKTDVLMTIRGSVSPADSITWVVSVYDLGATREYEQRSVSNPRVPLSAPLASVARLVSQALAALDQLDHAPRAVAKP